MHTIAGAISGLFVVRQFIDEDRLLKATVFRLDRKRRFYVAALTTGGKRTGLELLSCQLLQRSQQPPKYACAADCVQEI